MQPSPFGILYVIATPIGNLQDITLRAIEVLKSVAKVAVEDTRQTGKLLKHYSIDKPMISLHEFNERERVQSILTILQQGESIALVSDAGTPLISDPGYHLVNEVQAAGIRVVPIPGACAAVAALSAAGLPTDRFCFEGFLPAKTEARRERLVALQHETRTMIFYEAPHRILATLEALATTFGPERRAVTARELTKMFEQILPSTLSQLQEYFATHEDKQRGEFVLLVAGYQGEALEQQLVNAEQVLDILLTELPVKQAANLASKITGERKNRLYELALQKKGQ